MTGVIDLRQPCPSGPATRPATAPMAKVAAFASIAQTSRSVDRLLAVAAQALGESLPFAQVLIAVCAEQPPVVHSAGGSGWGEVSAQGLAALILPPPGETSCGSAGIGSDGLDGAVTDLKGAELEELRAVIAAAAPHVVWSQAARIRWTLRGHRIVALLGSTERTRALTEVDRSFASALFAVLATALQFHLRKRDYARRLKQIRGAKVAWEGTVDALPHLVCVLDQEGMIARANRAIEQWGLGAVETAPGRTLHELLHPGCANPECGLARRLGIAIPRSVGPKGQQFEYADPVFGRDLRVKIGHAAALSGPNGSPTSRRRFAVVEDVTREHVARRKVMRMQQELKRNLQHHSQALTTTHEYLRAATSRLADAQLELGETRRRHRLVLENTNAGLLMVKQGRVAYCNRRFEELLGYRRGELADAQIEDLFPAGCSPAQIQCSVDGEPVAPLEHVCQVRRKDGTSIWLRHAEAGFFTENDHVRFITVVNVTEQIVAERAMQSSRRELQRLSHCLMSSQEEERKRISGELHDGLGQSLSAVKLMLQQVAADATGRLDGQLAAPLSACVDKTQEMIEDVRRLSMALRPAIIDSSGVVLALTRLCRELKQSVRGLAVHLTTDIEEADVQDSLKIHVFRIVQEGLNNVIKHARAANVWIQLDRSEAGLRLAIRDDGVGFDLGETTAAARGARERPASN